jgi:hypothetical protein
VIFANVDTADELAFKACFISDGTDNVARFDAMCMAHFDAIGFALDAVAIHRDVGSGVLVGNIERPIVATHWGIFRSTVRCRFLRCWLVE